MKFNIQYIFQKQMPEKSDQLITLLNDGKKLFMRYFSRKLFNRSGRFW